jgi:hypothetical protein
VRNGATNATTFQNQSTWSQGGIPFALDFDGDGTAEFASYKHDVHEWVICPLGCGLPDVVVFGSAKAIPAARH